MTDELLIPKKLRKLIFGDDDSFITKGQLIHVYGEAGTGKTTLALQTTIGFCKLDKKVIYIDAEGKLSGNKIRKISGDVYFSTVNKNLKLYLPNDFNNQHELISKLDFYLPKQKIGLLIVDTITNFYRQAMLFRKDSKILYEKLAYQVAYLRNFAHERSIPVLLFNQATMSKRSEIKDNNSNNQTIKERINPVARAIMSYWADREIILEKFGWGEFEARIPRKFEGRVKFRINTNGISPNDE